MNAIPPNSDQSSPFVHSRQSFRALRQGRKLSQRELALKAGCSAPMVSKIERGQASLRCLAAARCWKVLGRPVIAAPLQRGRVPGDPISYDLTLAMQVLGFSAAQTARSMGVSNFTLRRWLAGSPATPRNHEKLARLLRPTPGLCDLLDAVALLREGERVDAADYLERAARLLREEGGQ